MRHRQLGVDLFNEVWRLMESREDDERMLHAAHASALARAHRVAGDDVQARHCEARARELGRQIADPEDREHLDEALATL